MWTPRQDMKNERERGQIYSLLLSSSISQDPFIIIIIILIAACVLSKVPWHDDILYYILAEEDVRLHQPVHIIQDQDHNKRHGMLLAHLPSGGA